MNKSIADGLGLYMSKFRLIDGVIRPDNVLSSDTTTIESFGAEWNKFQYKQKEDFEVAGSEYFDVLKPESLGKDFIAADIGCGTGRWARLVAPHVKILFGVDPSSSLNIAKTNCELIDNFIPVNAYAEHLPFLDNSMDFVMSLGVLHHIPDTEGSLREISRVLKPGARFLFYFYYNFEQKPRWFKLLFALSNVGRRIISRMPPLIKDLTCEIIAATIYLPFILIARLLKKIGFSELAEIVPLSAYANKNYYVIRTDARDRFGTPLEKRYSRDDIMKMLNDVGLFNVTFSKKQPFWHGYAIKA